MRSLRLLPFAAALPLALAAATAPSPARADDRSPFVGTRVGQNRHGEDVRVTREVGALAGYENRLLAISVARMAAIEPAVVVKGNDKRWHALETTANFYGGGSSADNYRVAEIYGLPSRTGIAGSQAKIDELLRRASANPRDASVGPELDRERMLHAQLVFGVEAKEIKFIRSIHDRAADVINVVPNLPDDIGGIHGPVGTSDPDFVKGAKTAITVSLKKLATPQAAAGTVFHEETHRLDYEHTQALASRYEADTRRTFMAGRPFTMWLLGQPASALARDEAELAADVAENANGATEAHANLRTFLAAIEAGAGQLAQTMLVAYAGALSSKPATYNAPGNYVTAASFVEMETVYRRSNAAEKKAFDDAFAAVRAKYPTAWFARFDHATALRGH